MTTHTPITMPSVSDLSNGTTSHTNGHSSLPGQPPSSSLPPTSSIPQKFLSNPNELGITLVGFSGGQAKPGTDAGPTALTDAGLLTQLSDDLGYTLHGDSTVRNFNTLSSERFKSNDPPIRGMKNPRSVSAVTEQISDLVYTQAREGRLALTIGGDHSIAVGTISGVARAIRERYPINIETQMDWRFGTDV